jgi:hypothetical protein
MREHFNGLKSPGSHKLSVEACQNWLLKFAKHSKTTTIIIDALDECEERYDLLKALKDLSSSLRKEKISVKLFLSSRDEVRSDIELNLAEQLFEINITSTKTDTDLRNFIQRYVTEKCERYPDLAREENSTLRERLVRDLAEKGKLAQVSTVLTRD